MIASDYAERVYAGVLGKIIGVYLGRPFEAWSYERIQAELGEIRHYVNGHPAIDAAKRRSPIVQTDDDISGTFTFLRALRDYGDGRETTPAQIGQTWLNYVVEERSTHWWGGVGLSTEHTAYLRLKDGLRAPRTGSAALNGKVQSEQIGAQIFVDGWAMAAPGDPELAADLARRAAGVSHDGEAIHAAQVVAAMEAQAFCERDAQALLDVALSLIPRDCAIARLVDEVRDWHAGEPDWRRTRARIADRHAYERYGGNCPVVPNHALILLGLLYGEDDFQRSLMIVNTSGWDTDCNSGNLGCLLGIKNGLDGIDAGPDWRGPVADRMYISSADGGRAITDAVSEAYAIVNAGRALAGMPPALPKAGARFHFEAPGSLQGFQAEGPATLANAEGHSSGGGRSLAIRFRHEAAGAARALTPTFIPPDAIAPQAYELLASPTLYPGQTVRAQLEADADNAATAQCRLILRAYDGRDRLASVAGPAERLAPGGRCELTWRIPDTGGLPIAQIGVELRSPGSGPGTLYLDCLGWSGAPDVTLTRLADGGSMWRRAWVDAVDRFEPIWPEPYRLVQNRGRGLLIQGTREWTDYEVSAPVAPHTVAAAGIAARVQGLRRYYALLLSSDGRVRLVKALDGERTLAESGFERRYGVAHRLSLRVTGTTLRAGVDGDVLFEVDDERRPLDGGAVALVCEEGWMTADYVRVEAAGGTAGLSSSR